MILRNARLVLPDRIQFGSLRLQDGRISALAGELSPNPDESVLDLGGQFLAPGFIDMHIHGALRRDSMEAASDAFAEICGFHARGGTTSLALTTVTAPSEEIIRVLEAVKIYQQKPGPGAQVLGVHIEGPYFSKERPGAHALDLIRAPKREEWSRWIEYADTIAQMTLAPELPGALELIDALVASDIRASAGHSDAWDDECAAAFAHGVRQTTHTFNCMSSARRRGPYRVAGLLEFAMSEPEILCELIADGRHVSPTLMRLLYQAKGPDGIALITDASGGAGLAEGENFRLLGITCQVKDDVGLTADGRSLAGSTSTMIRCVRNMVQMVGIALPEAIRMATLNPARALGLADRKGVLAAGTDADLVVFDDAFQVNRVFIGGRSID